MNGRQAHTFQVGDRVVFRCHEYEVAEVADPFTSCRLSGPGGLDFWAVDSELEPVTLSGREAHTNPEDDPVLLRAELEACRQEIARLRAEVERLEVDVRWYRGDIDLEPDYEGPIQ